MKFRMESTSYPFVPPLGTQTRTLTSSVLATMILTAFLATAAETTPAVTNKWEKDIAAFERADLCQPPPANAVLFVGSSSIRMWNTLSNDFPGVPLIQRGFGGSELSDTIHFAPRIIFPYAPRLIVVYAGDNDIANGKSAQKVFSDFKTMVEKVKQRLPGTRVAYLAIKPSIARWKLIEQIKTANSLIENWSRQDPQLAYIDIATPMLGTDGKPRPELFLADGLHLTPAGYKVWVETVRPHLQVR